jgi:hypothetical protein
LRRKHRKESDDARNADVVELADTHV